MQFRVGHRECVQMQRCASPQLAGCMAIGTPAEDHCDACFTGRYPLGDDEDADGKSSLEDIAVVR